MAETYETNYWKTFLSGIENVVDLGVKSNNVSKKYIEKHLTGEYGEKSFADNLLIGMGTAGVFAYKSLEKFFDYSINKLADKHTNSINLSETKTNKELLDAIKYFKGYSEEDIIITNNPVDLVKLGREMVNSFDKEINDEYGYPLSRYDKAYTAIKIFAKSVEIGKENKPIITDGVKEISELVATELIKDASDEYSKENTGKLKIGEPLYLTASHFLNTLKYDENQEVKNAAKNAVDKMTVPRKIYGKAEYQARNSIADIDIRNELAPYPELIQKFDDYINKGGDVVGINRDYKESHTGIIKNGIPLAIGVQGNPNIASLFAHEITHIENEKDMIELYNMRNSIPYGNGTVNHTLNIVSELPSVIAESKYYTDDVGGNRGGIANEWHKEAIKIANENNLSKEIKEQLIKEVAVISALNHYSANVSSIPIPAIIPNIKNTETGIRNFDEENKNLSDFPLRTLMKQMNIHNEFSYDFIQDINNLAFTYKINEKEGEFLHKVLNKRTYEGEPKESFEANRDIIKKGFINKGITITDSDEEYNQKFKKVFDERVQNAIKENEKLFGKSGKFTELVEQSKEADFYIKEEMMDNCNPYLLALSLKAQGYSVKMDPKITEEKMDYIIDGLRAEKSIQSNIKASNFEDKAAHRNLAQRMINEKLGIKPVGQNKDNGIKLDLTLTPWKKGLGY